MAYNLPKDILCLPLWHYFVELLALRSQNPPNAHMLNKNKILWDSQSIFFFLQMHAEE